MSFIPDILVNALEPVDELGGHHGGEVVEAVHGGQVAQLPPLSVSGDTVVTTLRTNTFLNMRNSLNN